MTGFTERIFDQRLEPEPPVKTQEIYGLLDNVVQKALTDENADVDDLLAKADADAQRILDKA